MEQLKFKLTDGRTLIVKKFGISGIRFSMYTRGGVPMGHIEVSADAISDYVFCK